MISDYDIHLFNEGTHTRLYDHLGARCVKDGTHFAVWAPNAESVSVIGDFNNWNPEALPLRPQGSSGIWTGFAHAVRRGAHHS